MSDETSRGAWGQRRKRWMGLLARQGESRHGSGDIKRQRVEGGRVNVLLKTQDSLNLMSLGENARKYAPLVFIALDHYATLCAKF